MEKYNIYKEKKIKLSKLKENVSYSTLKDPSTFLRSATCQHPPTRMQINFIAFSAMNVVLPFFITITRKRFSNVYYGYDSSTFCIVKSTTELKIDIRYVIYGKVSKLNLFFVECIKAEEISYKELCSSIV